MYCETGTASLPNGVHSSSSSRDELRLSGLSGRLVYGRLSAEYYRVISRNGNKPVCNQTTNIPCFNFLDSSLSPRHCVCASVCLCLYRCGCRGYCRRQCSCTTFTATRSKINYRLFCTPFLFSIIHSLPKKTYLLESAVVR